MAVRLVVRANILAGLVGLTAALFLGACGNDSRGPSNTRSDSDQGDEPTVRECTAGLSCACGQGQPGSTVCEAGFSRCECEPCPGLEVSDAPSVNGCGGEPFGNWRLTHVEWGRSQLQLSVFGDPVGSCDMMMTAVGDEPPRLLMSLYEGGRAEYFSESAPVKISYSESCVTSKVSQFTCGADTWQGVSNCNVDCDICTCDSYTGSTEAEDGTWARTQEELSLQLFGKASSFAYCATDNQLELSTPGAHFVFERVTKLSKPLACAERSATTCLTGEPGTCQLGACEGGPTCAGADSEGVCLTLSGCTWDASACWGLEQQICRLADFGVVPGCEITNEAVTCQGTATACDQRNVGECYGGCTVNEAGRCTGGPLQCEKFSVCPSACDEEYDYSCSAGTFACAGLARYACEDTADDYDGEACTWHPSFCEGVTTPCDDLSADECNFVPGCSLVTAP
jgi:hypothetical protein